MSQLALCPLVVRTAAVLVALVAAGCGDAPGGGRTSATGTTAGGKGDDLDEDSTSSDGGGEQAPSDHRDVAMQCEAVADHLRDHVNPARGDAIVDLERDRNDCLVDANDRAVRSVVDPALEDDPLKGQGSRSLRPHRDAALAACNALVEADPAAGTDGLAAVATACIAGVELHLALVLDAYVDFGVAPFSIPGARDRYVACYDALDAALEADPLAEVAAQESLAVCIRDEHDALVPELAARVAASFPGRDAFTIEDEIRQAVLALHDGRATLCSIAVAAGPSAGDEATGDETRALAHAECQVDVAIQAGEMITWIAADLLPEEGEPGGTDEGGSSDGGTSSDDSTSSDGGFESSTSY